MPFGQSQPTRWRLRKKMPLAECVVSNADCRAIASSDATDAEGAGAGAGAVCGLLNVSARAQIVNEANHEEVNHEDSIVV